MKLIKLPVKCGGSSLPPMTKAQAMAYGKRFCLKRDEKNAGFSVSIFESDPSINFGHFYRICVGKTVKQP